jgi:hypothetical protein
VGDLTGAEASTCREKKKVDKRNISFMTSVFVVVKSTTHDTSSPECFNREGVFPY